MKRFLQFLFAAIILLIAYGLFIKVNNEQLANRYIGFAVLALAFVFLPLFIYFRYKGKDLKKYTDLDKMIRENSELYNSKDKK